MADWIIGGVAVLFVVALLWFAHEVMTAPLVDEDEQLLP